MAELSSKNYEGAVKIISPDIREILLKVKDEIKREVTEIRLRANKPPVLVTARASYCVCIDGGVSLTADKGLKVSLSALNDTFNRLCGYSLHTHANSISNGYVTFGAGHRAGICGKAVCDAQGNCTSVREVSSISIRVAHECIGCADDIVNELFSDRKKSLILAGPVGSGKTTILRDMARQISSCGVDGCKVAVIDERDEIASVSDGVCGFDVGVNTDVLSSYSKKHAIETALRTLSPDVIICDEVVSDAELEAIEAGINSGVVFVVSVHASSKNELLSRPQIKRLLSTYGFEYAVLLSESKTPGRIAGIYETKELLDEICGSSNNLRCVDFCGDICRLVCGAQAGGA